MSSFVNQDIDFPMWKIKYMADQKVKFVWNLEQSKCKISILLIQVF